MKIKWFEIGQTFHPMRTSRRSLELTGDKKSFAAMQQERTL